MAEKPWWTPNGKFSREFYTKAGFVKNITYFKEMCIHEITDKWSIDLSAISNQGKWKNVLIL